MVFKEFTDLEHKESDETRKIIEQKLKGFLNYDFIHKGT